MPIDLTLEVGEVHDTVTVESEPNQVNLSTEQVSGLVGERQIKDLPLNGRSYDGLMTLNAGVVNYSSQRSGSIGTSNSAVGNMFAVSGRRPQENLFLLNGIEYTGASEINVTPGGASGQLLGVEAVREFNVVTDVYGAQYGKRPGAQVSIVTASGANQVHGSVYEFLRNSALDARNFFDFGSIPQFQRNEFGGAVGGPIRKDRTFVFGNYEGFRQRLGLSDVTLVPDQNARAGYLPDAQGNLVHVGITPAAKALLPLWPEPNGPSLGGGIGEAFSNPLQSIREDFGTVRLDHTFSEKDSLFGVYTIDDSADDTPTANPLSRVFEALREQVLSLQETHVFSATALNTVRAGFSRGGYYFTGSTPVNVPGFVQGAPVGAVVIGGGTALNGASQITLAGTNAGSNLTAVRNLFTWEDHVNLRRGAHQLEFGVWVQRIQNNDNLAQNQFGQASFGSLASFLAGTISTFTVVPSSTPLGWRSTEAAEYVQDSIRVTPALQLSLGLRIEHSNGMNEAHGRAANYLFDANGVIQTEPHVGDSVFTVNHGKFLPQPRAAIAWDPFGKQRTVIHAGFGMFHQQLDAISYRLDQNGPFNPTVSLKNVSLDGLLIVPGAALPSGSKPTPSGIQPDAKIPTVLSYNFKIEQQLGAASAVAVGYVGSRGYHEILALDANLPVPAFRDGQIYFAPGAPLANPNVGNTTTWWSNGASSYNALQIDVNRRSSKGLQFRAVYTFSKSLDDGSAWNSSVAANAPGFVMYPPESAHRLGPVDLRRAALGGDQRNVRASPGAREDVSEDRQPHVGQGDRRMDAGGHRDLPVGIPVYAATGLQSVERRRHAQSGAAVVESVIQRAGDFRRPERLFQSGGICGSGEWNLRQRRPGHADRSGERHGGSVGVEANRAHGTRQAAVPRRVLQPSEPRQFQHTQYSGILVGRLGSIADRGRHHGDLDELKTGPVRDEGAVLKFAGSISRSAPGALRGCMRRRRPWGRSRNSLLRCR